MPLREAATLYEAECVPGLEDFAERELSATPGIVNLRPAREGWRCEYSGSSAALANLKFVQAVYRVLHFDVPRPKALLGDAHLRQLCNTLDEVRRAGKFQSLRLAAAGDDSAVMLRLRDALARHTGLPALAPDGDLLLRVLPGAAGGWDALIRVSPRPIATRAWRVCNYEGALNAVVARAMAEMAFPRTRDSSIAAAPRLLNLCCGSGTLMIEAADLLPGASITGCDTDARARDCAESNIAAFQGLRAKARQKLLVHDWDATKVPVPDASVDGLLADLPFGNLVGSHAANRLLYPAVLTEAARVAKPGARFVLITNEVRLMTGLLAHKSARWRVDHERTITLRGLHPRIYVLSRVEHR